MTDQIAALRRRAMPEDQSLLDQLAAARSRHANLQLGGSSGKLTPAARQARLAASAQEIEKREGAISRRSTEFRVMAQPITLSKVQDALPANSALIEIFLYRSFDVESEELC